MLAYQWRNASGWGKVQPDCCLRWSRIHWIPAIWGLTLPFILSFVSHGLKEKRGNCWTRCDTHIWDFLKIEKVIFDLKWIKNKRGPLNSEPEVTPWAEVELKHCSILPVTPSTFLFGLAALYSASTLLRWGGRSYLGAPEWSPQVKLCWNKSKAA